MGQLHIFFFPFLAHGHMLPTIDMAKLFSSRGVKATLITTPYHNPMFTKAIESTRNLGFDISVRLIKFPSIEVGLPEGIESSDQISSEDLRPKFLDGCNLLQEPLEQLLQEYRPHALVADMFFYWANDSAAKFGIPRLLFHGSSYFAMSATDSIKRHKPYQNLSSDSDIFVVPDLPHEIKLTRGQISVEEREGIETEMTKFWKLILDSESKCYGVVMNSFYELEPDYVNHYKNVMGKRSWHVGPLLLCKKEFGEDVSQRGKESAINTRECLKWLNSKNPNSIVYICFGSMSNFTVAQLHEIAIGLELSGQEFIWVVRKCADEEDKAKWFPKGFEDRIKGKGLIIIGWAPQLMILEHESVGAFVTHCGWNSTLEGVCAGVPMVTWPMFAEQFYNEKLVTDVLRTGVAVGSQQWGRVNKETLKREAISKAICRVLVGEEAAEMRSKAKELKEMAKRAVEEGGSSYSDLSALFEELGAYHDVGKQE
uniref:Glycosyltransferase n=1 Tax=Eustoma russellianum TaxID=52518 RepID=A4F1S5_EUSRU|nr:putative glycosyltransferase [Eustoma grandiflorum]